MLEQRIEEVNQANRAFYAAFGNLDINEMDKVWAHQEYVTCIHPGWSLRSDWPAVRDSWVLIFNCGRPTRAFPGRALREHRRSSGSIPPLALVSVIAV